MENTGECLHENSCPAVRRMDNGDYIVVGKLIVGGTLAGTMAKELGLGVGPDEAAVIVPASVMPLGPSENDDAITIHEAEYEQLKEDSRRLARLEAAGVDNWDGYHYAFADDEDDE